MSSLQRRRLLLLVATGLLTLTARFALLTPEQSMFGVRFFGYWVLLAIVATAVWVTVRAFRGWRFARAVHLAPLIAAGACSVFLQLHEPRKLKVLYDEYVLMGTSMEMHRNRELWVPGQAQFHKTHLVISDGFVDKRPPLFAFLLSLVHDVSGYRIANVYVLNGIISLFLFWLLFWIGDAAGGRWMGYAAMLLMAGLPLVANVTTSGAYDLLNITLICAVILAAQRYLENPADDNQNLLVMSGILLAQTRYESILFLISLAAVVAWSWWKRRSIHVTRLAVISPAMLLLPLLCNQIYLSFDAFFESNQIGVAFFDVANVIPNLEHAVFYFFNFSRDLTNSPLLSFAGIASLLLMIAGFRTAIRKSYSKPGIAIAFFAFVPVALGNTALIMANFWGLFDDPVASRFSMPIQLFMVFAIVLVVAQVKARERAALALVGAAVLSIWAWTIPTNSRHASSDGFFSARETEWMLSVVLKNYDQQTMVVSECALPLITHERPAAPFVLFNYNPARFLEWKSFGLYKRILILQSIRVDPETGVETDISSQAPPFRMKLKTVAENSFQDFIISRISSLEGIEYGPDGKPIPTENRAPKMAGLKKPAETRSAVP